MRDRRIQKHIDQYNLKSPICHKVKIYLSLNRPRHSRSFPQIKGYLLETNKELLLIKRRFSILGLSYLFHLPFHIVKENEKLKVLRVSNTAIRVLHNEKFFYVEEKLSYMIRFEKPVKADTVNRILDNLG